jgi:acetolactate synthase regulatory subunit
MQRYEFRVETIAFKRSSGSSSGKVKAKSKDEQLCEALNVWGKRGWRVAHIEFRPLMQAEETEAQVVLERSLGHWLLNEDDD